MGVFDELIINDSNGNQAISVQRGDGPIESGTFEGGVWVPASYPQHIDVENFGVDGSGNPYYDTNGPTNGEAAALYVDPTIGVAAGAIWLER